MRFHVLGVMTQLPKHVGKRLRVFYSYTATQDMRKEDKEIVDVCQHAQGVRGLFSLFPRVCLIPHATKEGCCPLTVVFAVGAAQHLQGSLRQQVILSLHAEVISKIPAFAGRSSTLVAQLVDALEVTMHAPGNVVMVVSLPLRLCVLFASLIE
jgi:hypothetical protein